MVRCMAIRWGRRPVGKEVLEASTSWASVPAPHQRYAVRPCVPTLHRMVHLNPSRSKISSILFVVLMFHL